MSHCMIDIETLGTREGCAILQVAAAKFALPSGEVTGRFMSTINPSLSEVKGTIDFSTLGWWRCQDPKIMDGVFAGKHELSVALTELGQFIQGSSTYWAKSPSFDMLILRSAFERCSLTFRPKFWKWRDCRTLEHRALDAGMPRRGHKVAHDALADVLAQIEDVSEAWRYLEK